MSLEPEPPFHDLAELRRTWGREWGAWDDVGPLREVLVRPPGRELEQITADTWNAEAGALVDPGGGWYWIGEQPPDIELARSQHAGLVAALEAEDVLVHRAPPMAPSFVKASFTRDPLVAAPGGTIVARMAATMRRGEERDVTAIVGGLAIPILRTITGTATVEGGTVVRLRPGLVAYGQSIRCNTEGARQLQEALSPAGVEVVVVPVPGYGIHLDGYIGLADVDKALVRAEHLPFWFLERLEQLGYELIPCPIQEPWGVNLLAVAPGRVIMSESAPHAAEALARAGVEVIAVPYSEIEKNGGGVHCSTQELWREQATST